MYTLVLVEDDYQIRNGLNCFFPWHQIGFDLIKCFENGKQAFDFLVSNQVDVVMTDIEMPIMNGLTLASELKKIKYDGLIIFLSAYGEFAYAQQAVELGVVRYILKSTKYDDLTQNFIEIKQLLDNNHESNAYTQSPSTPPYIDDMTIQKVIDYMNADIANATLQSLADKVNMSPVYLSRYFKEKSGMNYIDYLLHIKMKKATELLRTELTIAQISEIVGYSNEKNFSRAFKKQYGVSPSEYKRIQ